MSEDTAPSCHQRPSPWTRRDAILGALVWTFIVLMTFAWTHRDAITLWLGTPP